MQHRPATGVEVAQRVHGDVARGGLAVAGQVPGQEAGIAGQHVVAVQAIGLAAEAAAALQPAHEAGLVAGAGQLDLGGGQALLQQQVQLGVDRGLDLGQVVARGGGHLDGEGAAHLPRLLGRPDVLGDLALVDQGLVEARVLALGQDVAQQVELGVAGLVVAGGVPGQVQARQLDRVLGHGAALAVEGGQPALDPVHRPARLDAAEEVLDHRLDQHGVEVAGQAEAGVVGRVVEAEEIGDVLDRGGRQVVHAADHRVGVGMALGVEQLQQQLVAAGVGLVLGLALLVLHHVALVVQLLLGHGRQQAAHAVGLQPQGQLHLVAGHVLPVVGAVLVGRAVDLAADLLQGHEVVGVVVLGALEHHVLEQVGEPGAARPLVLRTHVVPDVDRHHGDGVVLVQDHVQAVGQGVVLELQLRQVVRRCGGAGQQHTQRQRAEPSSPVHVSPPVRVVPIILGRASIYGPRRRRLRSWPLSRPAPIC